MKRLLEKLRDDLSWYVDQKDHMMMVFDCTDVEVAYILKVLQQVEGEHVGDMFLMFAHPITSPEAYVLDVVSNINAQLTAINAVRQEEGLAPWPPLPPLSTDPRYPAPDRLKHIIQYLIDRLPAGDHHLVIGLLPAKMHDRTSYAKVVSGLFPRDGLEPWMDRLRLLVRDDRNKPFLLPHLADQPVDNVLIYDQLDLSTPALIQAIENTATDEDVPEHEKMMAIVQIAALDFSYQRYDESYKKWGMLFGYYAEKADAPMQALALCGAADVLRQVGKLAEAKERYQQGIALASTMETLPVALNLFLGVGEVCMRRNEWAEANGYLELAEKIAKKVLQTFTLCDVLERRGIALMALSRVEEAKQLWRASVDLSREIQHQERAVSVLGHLIRLYADAHMREERRALEQELALVREEIAQRDAAHSERYAS